MGARWGFALAGLVAVVAIAAIVQSEGPVEDEPSTPFRYGFSNHFSWNRGALFEDPRLDALKLKDYRVVVPYDIADAKDERDPCRRVQWKRFSDSYQAAMSRGMSVMVAFERVSTCDVPEARSERFLPSDAEYLRAVRRLRGQFPGVEWFAAWNEPNHPAQPTSGSPRRAARYLELLQTRVCTPADTCRTVGAELAVRPGWRRYLNDYLASLAGVRMPTRWGIHPYDDVDRAVAGNLNPTRTGRVPEADDFRDRIRRVNPAFRVWLTEVGSFGRVQSEAQQAEEVRYLVDDLAPRLNAERVYYWSFWDHRGRTDRGFDTMLIRMPPASTDIPQPSTRFPEREAYDVYRCYRRADADC